MKIHVFLLEFRSEGSMILPKDPLLHKLAVDYANRELAVPVNFSDLRNVWVACEVDAEYKPVKVHGLLGMVLKPDFPLVRFTDNAACKKLFDRANAFLADQGGRGTEAFVWIPDNEAPDQRCPNWQEWLEAFGMKRAERYSVTVR